MFTVMQFITAQYRPYRDRTANRIFCRFTRFRYQVREALFCQILAPWFTTSRLWILLRKWIIFHTPEDGGETCIQPGYSGHVCKPGVHIQAVQPVWGNWEENTEKIWMSSLLPCGARGCKRSVQYCIESGAKGRTRKCPQDCGRNFLAIKKAEYAQAVTMWTSRSARSINPAVHHTAVLQKCTSGIEL